MQFTIPEPLKIEHDELHEELAKATRAGGRVGETAQAVAQLLHPHFVQEEEFALPPLALLRPLAEDRLAPDMAEVLAMTDRLETELPRMLAEHEAIVAALDWLVEAARDDGKPDVARFAEKLILHARTEEDVLYPAALVVGRYVKMKLWK